MDELLYIGIAAALVLFVTVWQWTSDERLR